MAISFLNRSIPFPVISEKAEPHTLLNELGTSPGVISFASSSVPFTSVTLLNSELNFGSQHEPRH